MTQKILATDPAKILAMALDAITQIDEEEAERRADYKARRETMTKEVNRLKREILTGQDSLPLEVQGHD